LDKIKLSEKSMPMLLSGGVRFRDEQLPIIFVPNKKKNRGSAFFVKRVSGEASPAWIKIGVWPDVPVPVLKSVARQMLADAAYGQRFQDTAKKSQFGQMKTVANVLSWYQSDMLTDHFSDSRNRNVKSLIAQHFMPKLGDCNLCDLSHPVIKNKLVDVMANKKYALSYIDLACRTLQQIFAAAHRSKMIEHNPLDGLRLKNFTTAVVKPKKAAYHAGHLKAVISAIGKERQPRLRVMIGMILLHALRVDEVAGLNWSENIDVDNKMLRLAPEQTKNAQGHILPLTGIALDMLRYHKRTQRKAGHRGNWLFPAKRNPKKSCNSSYASDLVSQSLGKGSAHDLRKLARVWFQENKIDFFVGELLLNHKAGVLSLTYIQSLLLDSCRESLQKWHEKLCNLGLMEAVCGEPRR
jgi:integrase